MTVQTPEPGCCFRSVARLTVPAAWREPLYDVDSGDGHTSRLRSRRNRRSGGGSILIPAKRPGQTRGNAFLPTDESREPRKVSDGTHCASSGSLVRTAGAGLSQGRIAGSHLTIDVFASSCYAKTGVPKTDSGGSNSPVPSEEVPEHSIENTLKRPSRGGGMGLALASRAYHYASYFPTTSWLLYSRFFSLPTCCLPCAASWIT